METGLSTRIRDAADSETTRSRNQALEIVKTNCSADRKVGWLERADLVGQVCGSSPHGPAFLFNALESFLQSSTKPSPVILHL
jgi:hypothetical protein